MVGLYLCLATAFSVLLSFFKKLDASATGSGAPFLFNSIFALFAGVVFFVSSGLRIKLPDGALLYLPLTITTYVGSLLFSYLSIKTGPLSITSVASSFGLLIPVLYGIIVYGESPSIPFIIGLMMLIACIILISADKKENSQRVSLRWAILTVLSVAFGGSFTTVQNLVGRAFVGKSNSGIMTLTLLCSAVVFFSVSLMLERKKIKERLKSGILYMAGAGICNGASNLFVLLVIPLMSASVLYPVMSVSSLVAVLLISAFFFKEHLSKRQWLGVVIGVVSALLMNLK